MVYKNTVYKTLYTNRKIYKDIIGLETQMTETFLLIFPNFGDLSKNKMSNFTLKLHTSKL